MLPNILTPGGSSAYSSPELARLTVPQLKAICKEKKISGYSKLGKQALIEKLKIFGLAAVVSAGACATSCSSSSQTTATLVATILDGTSSARVGSFHGAPITPQPTTTVVKNSKPKGTPDAARAQPSPISPFANIKPSSQILGANATEMYGRPQVEAGAVAPSDSGSHFVVPLLPKILGPTDTQPSKAMTYSDVTHQDASSQPALSTSKRTLHGTSKSMLPPPLKRSRILPPSLAPQLLKTRATASTLSVLVPPKRFKPLVVTRHRTPNTATSLAAQPEAVRPTTGNGSLASIPDPPLLSLESIIAIAPELSPITMPPTLAQRKRVHRWAVILSGLSNNERVVCVLVSRVFRYAVYLSASCILAKDYAGRRLREDVLRKYSQAMTNMWPYLRVREIEIAKRRGVYQTSFIWRFFEKLDLPDPISPRVWASPDDPKQLLIAVRFALTRAWFELSLGSSRDSRTNPDSWLRGTIVDVQEIVPGEVWSVTIDYPACSTRSGRRDTLFALEATCEIIGRPSKRTGSNSAASNQVTGLPIRADWSTYIAQRIATGSVEKPLISYLKWACQEDYDRGLSRLWLKKIAAEGPLGAVKRTVAERYVMACTTGNSISGEWMTTNEMAQEFAGMPARVDHRPGKQKGTTLNLFLPQHHHVESVHFTAANGRSLHDALAVVQTPHREYFILRDNGMQVGCEEEGVGGVWQEVLGCDYKGVPV